MEDVEFSVVEDGVLFGKYNSNVNSGLIQFMEGKKRKRARAKRSNIVSK